MTRTLLQQAEVPGTNLETRLYLITYPPGASAPRHLHPVAGLGYVLSGAAVSAFEGEAAQRIVAGESFDDRAGTPHILFRNANPRKPLVFLISYTVQRGGPVLIPAAVP